MGLWSNLNNASVNAFDSSLKKAELRYSPLNSIKGEDASAQARSRTLGSRNSSKGGGKFTSIGQVKWQRYLCIVSLADDLLRRLFPSRSKGNEIPLDSGLLKRNPSEIEAYQSWFHSGDFKPLLASINRAYYLKVAGIDDQIKVQRYTSLEANGFYFTYRTDFGVREIQFLFDLFRDRVLDQGYYLYVSDRKAEEKGEKIITTHRHYLKPPNRQEGLTEQRFGNVLIELVWVDRQPSYLKVMAFIYQDSRFEEALPFDELAEHLLSP